MRTFRSTRGPFTERPYYTDAEIERTCSEELRSVGLFPSVPEAIRIDRFVEKRFQVTITYDDLGPGILGFTQFGKAGVKAVVVSRRLDDEGTDVAERRVRSTLAHEAGHALFHTHLFLLTGQCALFPEGTASRPRVLCREDASTGTTKYKGEWWEYQANRAIGSLLLPRSPVYQALSDFTISSGALGTPTLPAAHRDAAARHLAGIFNVNPVVARLRLSEILPEDNASQLTL